MNSWVFKTPTCILVDYGMQMQVRDISQLFKNESGLVSVLGKHKLEILIVFSTKDDSIEDFKAVFNSGLRLAFAKVRNWFVIDV